MLFFKLKKCFKILILLYCILKCNIKHNEMQLEVRIMRAKYKKSLTNRILKRKKKMKRRRKRKTRKVRKVTRKKRRSLKKSKCNENVLLRLVKLRNYKEKIFWI